MPIRPLDHAHKAMTDSYARSCSLVLVLARIARHSGASPAAVEVSPMSRTRRAGAHTHSKQLR